VRDFSTPDEAVAHAQKVLPDQLRAVAQRAGADQVVVQMERRDREAQVAGGWEQRVYLGTELTFTAVGRPSLVREARTDKNF
jgi:hypothetical protein